MSVHKQVRQYCLKIPPTQVYIPADECVFDEEFPANMQKSGGGGGERRRNQRRPRRKSIRASEKYAAEVSEICFEVSLQRFRV